MTTLTDPPREGFRLSQLIYDTRYRSMTIQVIASLLIMLGLAYLAANVVQNLSALGKDFDFGFLGNPAGYDINQRLVEYDSQSTHAKAALVGILNTLLVAVLGCALATVLGVLVGVLRLSNNWIVSRLMSVYVEGFRNVPLLLWILVIFAIMTEGMPAPRDFRGETPAASMALFDSVAATNRGVYVPGVVFERSLGESRSERLERAVLADAARADGEEPPLPPQSIFNWIFIIAVLVGSVFAARRNSQRAKAIQEETGERPQTLWTNLTIIFLPLIVVLWGLGARFDYPALQGFNFGGGIHLRNSLIALWLALSLYTSAFIAELVRASIMSVSKGQTEASFALGLRPGRTMNLVILPQALRVLIPPLISQYLNLTKNSSLALAVGYMDVRSTLGGITVNQTGRELEGILLLGLFYLITSLLISAGMNVYNNSVKLKER